MRLFGMRLGGAGVGFGFNVVGFCFPLMKIKTKQINKDRGAIIKIKIHQGFLPMSLNLSANGPTIHAAQDVAGIESRGAIPVCSKTGASKIAAPIAPEIKTQPKYHSANATLPILTGPSALFLSFMET